MWPPEAQAVPTCLHLLTNFIMIVFCTPHTSQPRALSPAVYTAAAAAAAAGDCVDGGSAASAACAACLRQSQAGSQPACNH
jgi:hypothetical protein